ncbi:MAG: excinuclease ABC subunit UvrA [Verrucomicrobiales bacterium]|jgi:excinuclease ABC subunit A|nr:excinuclease ABC subunit UvrA [Verrucomicrobiales bacterium]
MPQDHITISGARQHNLQNLSLSLPRNKLVVITGPSGSGKSSLAFDTLFAEGQRRYVQSLSSYARQFLDLLEKPDVDSIEGLSPAVAIEQRGAADNPRSTIATSTEIYDYLRVLFAACGQAHHPVTGVALRRLSTQEIVDKILGAPAGARLVLLAPVVSGGGEQCAAAVEQLRKDGFIRARVDGVFCQLDEPLALTKTRQHSIEAVIDRLKVAPDLRRRLTDSIETALRLGQGVIRVLWLDQIDNGILKTTDVDAPPNNQLSIINNPSSPEWFLSNQNFDPVTGYHFPRFTARDFSFNSPAGACPACHGLGTQLVADAALVVPDDSLSLAGHAIAPWQRAPKRLAGHYRGILRDLARHAGVDLETPWRALPEKFRRLVLHGSGDEEVVFTSVRNGVIRENAQPFDGVLAQIASLHEASASPLTRYRMAQYMSRQPCAACDGKRLRKEVLAVTIGGEMPAAAPRFQSTAVNIHEFCRLTIGAALAFIARIPWTEQQRAISGELVGEISTRLAFLNDVGVGYLNLDRETGTLSGGELQRIRLATQIGAGLTGVLYILDEPSIGLHQRDNARLLQTLRRLRDLGNTVLVVEHDEDTIRAADYVVDIGPGAGARGGRVVAAGTPAEVAANGDSLTGQYLSRACAIGVPRARKPADGHRLNIIGATENNLRDLTVSVPLGCITCVTGVSGSGKSTLVNEVLSKALFRHFYRAKEPPGAHRGLSGLEHLDKVITIDQSPIGRTPRSNPLTYIGAFNAVRDLFARLPAARVRGYGKGRFSFNTPGGRCEHCAGDGYKKIEMHFLPDVYVPCEACQGRRFNRETLDITYKDHNIADVLALTVSEGLELFGAIPAIAGKLAALSAVGLGYLHMGQSATTLSGGEAQRVKLAAELGKRSTGRTCFIMDEPTTGLHFADVEQLMRVLFNLRDAGNTIIIIEHHLDVIKCADWIIDLGPEGGAGGGRVVAEGTPETVADHETSHTGKFLKVKLHEQKFEKKTGDWLL